MDQAELLKIIEEAARTKQTSLSLSGHQLSSLPPEIGQLTNLTELFLSVNRLSSLPPEIGQLTNLTTLSLVNNKLSSLPPEIGQLINLRELSLHYNDLNSLPPEIGQLTNLRELDFFANPLNNLLSFAPEVKIQGTRALLTYLLEQLYAGTKQWISKLLVVGEGGVGKTSLLRALNGQPFDEQESTTHGIEIISLKLAHPKEADVTMQLNTWDFGGQEIYHATHQFFLTNRSLFLLAWNARLGWEQGKLIYWLKTIRANAPDSPILLVATHIDERDANLPLSDLQEQFPQVIGQWEISNKTNQGVGDLRQAITTAAANLPLMGESWPTTWLKFAEAVRVSKTRYVLPQRFWQIMTQCEVKSDSHRILATWLHELGDILFFQDNDDLNDLVILKPQWVTEYISKVLEAEEVIQRNGIFTRICMEQLWHDLDAPMRDHFLRLMERFDLSYRTLENKDISLVVERLPFEPPDYEALWDAKRQEANCKEISMKFQLSEVLPGIPTWFIARQHRFTIEVGERRGIHWRTGVLFQDREQKHLALTKVGRDDRTNAKYLQLTVRGPMPHSFFDLLKEGIELTLRRYPGLQITRLIPCPDPNQERCLHEFDYANLVKRLERTPPKEEIECPNCLENISAAKLLFGLHWTTQDAVLARLDRIQEGQSELRELVQSQFLRQFRQQQKYLESYCPNVFVLRPDDRRPWQKDIGLQRINLQLYCQMPGCMHPTIDPDKPKKPCGLYAIDEPQQWLQTITPYYRRMVGVLKFATPLIGPWLGIMEAKDYQEIFKSDIDFAKELVNKLPDSKGFPDLDYAEALPGSERRLEHLDGSALRSLRQFLDRKDTISTGAD
ncbi:MAG: GTPase [Leptolyngbyaceae cyanobacterium RU_5_1]|nr:GTPase [Leptolyngbyaceae cyanobacterium RU_5_1]